MASITKVALVGAKGNLGEAVLDRLLSTGFEVTVLSRPESTQVFPAAVSVKKVDYDSLDSLTDALRGQDAVVSTIASAALGKQLLLIDAAAKAGVKRFIPSEFGADTTHEKTSPLPGFKTKLDVQEALKKAAAEDRLTYTIILNGPFLDWGIRVGFLANVKERTIDLADGGNRKASASTLATVAKAVEGVLKNPEQTKNRAVYVQDTAISQKELEERLKKATGTTEWTETVSSVEEGVKQGWEEAKKAQPDPWVLFGTTVKAAIWGDGYGGHFQKLDNDLFGIKELTEAELQAVIEKSLPN
ncbi:NAD(P)-binding protein [Durotheca rogersii]|uniref:NAD(P)-binding protein n=1 Tax=Durotheca rogersii TaxID=419775 RepID=UPI00221E8533|nr:NAD(P)-binding protein [Durotheca rogersii]KAI5863711.1 NAD(P)-binding protein [Durotheca rogersii]